MTHLVLVLYRCQTCGREHLACAPPVCHGAPMVKVAPETRAPRERAGYSAV